MAVDGGKVLGGLTAYILAQYYTIKPVVYIYDLAVQTKFQRQGIGKQLLLALKDYGKSWGFKELFVQAHEEDSHALEFYQNTGGIPDKVVHYTYQL